MHHVIHSVAVPLVVLEQWVCRRTGLTMSVTDVVVISFLVSIVAMFTTQIMRGGNVYLWSGVTLAAIVVWSHLLADMNGIYRRQNSLRKE